MKSEVEQEKVPEIHDVVTPYIVPESVESNQENMIIRMHKRAIERLKIFLELNETVG